MAAEAVDQAGEPNEGSNRQAEYDAEYQTRPGYYPDSWVHYIAVNFPQEAAVSLREQKFLHSMTISVAVECREQDLIANSFYLGESPGYHDDPPVRADVIFHVVDASWLCNALSEVDDVA